MARVGINVVPSGFLGSTLRFTINHSRCIITMEVTPPTQSDTSMTKTVRRRGRPRIESSTEGESVTVSLWPTQI